MKKNLLKLIAVLVVLAFIQSCEEPVEIDEPTDGPALKSAAFEKKSYIVLLNDLELNDELSKLKGYDKKQEKVKATAAKILKRAGIFDGEVEHVYGTALKGFSVKIPPGQLKKLEADPSVVRIEEDRVATLIVPGFKLKKEGDVTGQALQPLPWGVARVNGGINYTGSNVAWVLDSGIDLDHPDLNVNTSLGHNFIRPSKSPDDDNGHGSHVAGTIAALNNDYGVVGVAAGAEVVPVKVLDRRGSGAYSVVIAGVDYVAANGQPGDVANMSLGGPVSDALDEAVYNASQGGVKFVLAAGNEYDWAYNHSPARVNGPNILTISAMAEGDLWADFSNRGNPPVDYCAPGVDIVSCYKGGGYAISDGTSMAAPHVAGLMLLGKTKTDGAVNNDPDGTPDPILVYDGEVTPPPPPENQPPVAAFSYVVDNLSVSFSDLSSDPDGDVVSWSWDFGDGNTSTAQNPAHSYGTSGTYTVSLTVTDNQQATDSISETVTVTSSPGGSIVLTASGYKVRGVRYVDLEWSGAAGPEVDIKINGVTETTTPNDGSETLNLGRVSGTFVFTVCETDNPACSNNVTITF